MGVSLRHQWHDTIWGGVISPRRPRLFMIWYVITWPLYIWFVGGVWMHPRYVWYDMIWYDLVWWLAVRALYPFHVWYIGASYSMYTLWIDGYVIMWLDLFECLWCRSARGFPLFLLSIRVSLVDKPLFIRAHYSLMIMLTLISLWCFIQLTYDICSVDRWPLMHLTDDIHFSRSSCFPSYAFIRFGYPLLCHISVHWAF